MKIYQTSLIVMLLLSSCATKRQLESAKETPVEILLPTDYSDMEKVTFGEVDTLTTFTDKEGTKHTIGRNTLDEKTGEQLMTVGLQEVKVTARFKNVAERSGFVRIAFNVHAPLELINDNWELYLYPQSKVNLPGITITGENFRKKQERQYEYYNQLCKVILPEDDLNQYLDRRELEKEIARHNRQILRDVKLSYRKTLRKDTYQLQTSRDTALFVSRFMDKNKVNRNEYFKKTLSERFDKFVTLQKRDSIKKDFIANPDSTFDYIYTAEIPASDLTGRISLTMGAEIRTLNSDVYPIRISDSLSFVVSSLRNFIQTSPNASEKKYRDGLELLSDGDYKASIEILRPYADTNTAIAYLALGFDQIAYNTLVKLPECADNLYLLSIASTRLKKEKEAVNLYLKSCEMDGSKKWRGNLDPEISLLIKKYDLHKDEF